MISSYWRDSYCINFADNLKCLSVDYSIYSLIVSVAVENAGYQREVWRVGCKVEASEIR